MPTGRIRGAREGKTIAVNTLLSMVSLMVGLVALITSTLERRSRHQLPIVDLIRERFARPGTVDVLLGLGFGSVVGLGPMVVAAAMGWIAVSAAVPRDLAYWGLVLVTLAVKLAWAAAEELIFRGAILPQVSRYANGWVGLGVSALLFGWGHLERSGAQAPDVTSLVVFGLDGLGFGLAFLATRSLWLPSIWHAAKNVWLWLLFGQSTFQLTDGLARVVLKGPGYWIGAPNQAGGLDLIFSALLVVVLLGLFGNRIAGGAEWVRRQ